MPGGRHPQLRLIAGASSHDERKPGELDWSKLMARAQDGDQRAYRTLLEDLAPYLRSQAGRFFQQANEVEDAVQDVLLTVHLVRQTYDPARPFGPWLVAIANRRFIDRLRRQTRRKTREIALAAEHETFPEPASNIDLDVAEQAALREAIKTLPPDQRQAVTLLKLNELSLKEASAQSGRSVAALKVAVHRAVKNLRAILKAKGGAP